MKQTNCKPKQTAKIFRSESHNSCSSQLIIADLILDLDIEGVFGEIHAF